ncbi:MAG: N-formylglutamate amidohydrolase, partial [Acidiferrobacterales bacterium]
AFWRSYHIKIREELERIREQHSVALLYEAHSIRSRVPRFFEGVLPDFNLGTADGKSCSPALESKLAEALKQASGFTSVVNGRFKGGYITRKYGSPEENIHAVQLELSQATYMDEEYPFTYRDELATKVQPSLKALLNNMLEWTEEQSGVPSPES